MTQQVRWGILGTGSIARNLARAVKESDSATLQAVGSRARDTADSFAAKFEIPNAHESYEQLLGDSSVDLVYITTPHPMHEEWAIKAARAGKHVLCEKPVTMNAAQAGNVIRTAAENKVFLMEAFMYRCHPQTHRLHELIADGAVGEVRAIHATFAIDRPVEPGSRLFAAELGGGGILDLGCYCVSMSRLAAGAALGKTVAEPLDLKAFAHIGEIGTDEWAGAVLRFDNDIIAHATCGFRVECGTLVTVYGSDGSLTLTRPYHPSPGGENPVILWNKKGRGSEEIVIESAKDTYTIEVDRVGEQVLKGQTQYPFMTWDDTLGNMRALDKWREQVGLHYPCE